MRSRNRRAELLIHHAMREALTAAVRATGRGNRSALLATFGGESTSESAVGPAELRRQP